MPKKPLNEAELREMRIGTFITLANNALRGGEYASALGYFEEALALDGVNTRALLGRCMVLAEMAYFDEALRTAHRILEVEPRSARGYNALGTVYHLAGRNDEARVAFERSLALGPDLSEVHYNVACFWAAIKDAEKCKQELTEALRLDPSSHILAATDVDFEGYRDEPWFEELVAFKP